MNRTLLDALRLVIVVIFGGLLVAQVVVLPWLGAAVVSSAPESSTVRWWVLGAAIAVLACVQVALVCVGLLLAMVEDETVFAPDALRHVDVIIGAVVVATALVTAMNLLLGAAGATQPTVVLVLASGTVGGTGLGLLMVVMRALLTRATTLRVEVSGLV